MSACESSPTLVRLTVADEQVGQRLDAYLANQLPLYSRMHLRRVINAAGVRVDGQRTKAAYRLRAGQRVTVQLPQPPREGPRAENIPLDILYEDDWLVVVNKRPAMVVHPAKGHWSGTLTAALAYHFEHLSSVGGPSRPGIVHRLDRDTSGVIIVAKTDRAHLALAAQFEARTVEKEYLAVVTGVPDRDRDMIDRPIGAHPHHREKMAIRDGDSTSRDAKTFYEVAERFDGFAAVRVFPKTGRTHQIRLHLAGAGHAVLCDRLYGTRATITRGEIHRGVDDEHVVLNRMALHARRLKLIHPTSSEPAEFEAPLPEDIAGVLNELRASGQR